MSTIMSASARERSFAVLVNRALLGFSRHWLLIITVILGIYVGLPWLAPVFMEIGWAGAGKVIYLIYSTQCHQLPQRSFFLFGPQAMYSLADVQAVWRNTTNPFILRQFVGSAAMGWKVAWSDRMASMYGGVFLGSLIFWPLRKRLRPLPLWAFALLILPMGIDGGTHMISDLAGLGNGFRDSNIWLAALTGNIFPAAFYVGDVLGSFNSWMRLLTGLLFGLAIVWLAYPALEEMFAETAREIEGKFRKAGLAV